MQQKSYKNPPIAQILMDFVFKTPLSTEDFQSAAMHLEETLTEYQHETIKNQMVRIHLDNGSTNHETSPNVIHKFQEKNKKNSIELHIDRLIVTRFSPYKGRGHFQNILKLAISPPEVKGQLVSKVGLRAINNFSLKTERPLTEYVLTAPATSPLSGFQEHDPDQCLSQHVYVSGEDKSKKAIIHTVLRENSGFQNITLDIDIIEDFHKSKEDITVDDVIESKYANLSDKKNYIFESVITNELRASFND